ncbi:MULTISPECIES: hypothetical protein [unclassified Paraburkholderia]|uniref:hypothetical protein n=1 Tax=unclassified Paraburkholderia TaxID=2615204 RepID=UPI00160EBC5F|nr:MULTISPECIES: hypothetical protein [unclassified Paraburkholderia]MBB5441444.1 hypothetical protein [Paraburkholderia sp. WSM4177]MBB5481839.1 hypothetical protein [Paraburkholderia sp. WSM4180]
MPRERDHDRERIRAGTQKKRHRQGKLSIAVLRVGENDKRQQAVEHARGQREHDENRRAANAAPDPIRLYSRQAVDTMANKARFDSRSNRKVVTIGSMKKQCAVGLPECMLAQGSDMLR